MHGFCDEYKRKVAELQAELDKLYGPKCERSDEECPDGDTEHPYHESAMVKAHELGQEKMRATLRATQVALDTACRERDEAIAHDRQPYPTAWSYELACEALRKAKDQVDKLLADAHVERDGFMRACSERESARDAALAQVEQLTYERDRARMMSDASGHLAEYRMYRIFDLEKELEQLNELVTSLRKSLHL